MGLNKQRDLRNLHSDLGVPNPYLVLETMVTYEISKEEWSCGMKKRI